MAENETAIRGKTSEEWPEGKKMEAITNISNNMGIILDKPKMEQYATLGSRKQTFCDVGGTGFEIHQWAEAGFLFVKTTGKCVCFHCSISVEPIENEDPWKIHVTLFPYCAHVRHCKGDKFVLELLAGEQSGTGEGSDTDSTVERAFERNKLAIDAVREMYKDESLVRHGVEFILYSKAKLTFSGYELAMVIEELSDGETQEGKSGDEKGQTQPDDPYELKELEEENERLLDTIKCKICFDGLACIIILPCGHMPSCPQCISALRHCPLCRKDVNGTVRALFATSSGEYGV